MAKSGLTKASDIKLKARELDFVTQFNKNWDALREILGIIRPIKKMPGTQLVSYTTKVTLEKGNVGEGEEIPYSKAEITPVKYGDVTVEKYSKAVSIESVNKFGAAVAVQRTDNEFRNELQSDVMGRFYDFLKTGSLVGYESTFQMAVAMSIGKVKDKFKKMHRDITSVVVWVNTLDAYAYLGAQNLTIQSQFGIDYVKNFLGADVVILSSEIERDTVIATPVDNIDLYYIDPGDSEFAELGLDYTVQGETNLIGFHAEGAYKTAVGESYALMGMTLWAEYLDGIAVTKIGEPTPEIKLNKSATTIVVEGTETLVATTVPEDAKITWTSDDTDKVTVDDGVITGVAEGSATITASITVDGTSYTDTCEVTVEVAGA